MTAGRVATGLVAVLFVVGSAGCTGGPPGDDSGTAAPASVIVPGRPGESAAVLPLDQANRIPRNITNEADVRYARMMIDHHRQALEMTELVPQRSGRADLRGLAARIADSQGPEIKGMEAWLRQRGQQVPGTQGDHGGAGHEHHGMAQANTGMAGMATPEQLSALRAVTGAEFDRLFLQLMITHHEGAVTMATEVLSTGSDVFVEEMAQEVVAGQTDEITRMKTMQAG